MKGYLLDTSICVFLFREHREVTHNVKHFSHISGLKIEDWVES